MAKLGSPFVVVMVLLAGFVMNQGSVLAAETVTYQLGPTPDSYIIRGSGFAPGQVVWVAEIPCPDLPCQAEAMANVRDVPVGDDGRFEARLQADAAFEPVEPRGYRIVVVVKPGELLAIAGQANVRVPLHHPGAPSAPATGTGTGSPERGPAWWLVETLVLSALTASGVTIGLLVARRKS